MGGVGGQDQQGHKKYCGGNGYVYYPDWGNDFTCMYIYIKTYQIMYFKYVPFVVYQLCLSKTVLNRHVASGYIIGQCSSKATTKRKIEKCIINKLVKG